MTPNADDTWDMSAIEVNAYYTPLFNAIYIPYGIAGMPLYDEQLPDMMNIAGLGAIIAHEIGHAIDPSGINFDSRGKHDPWMSQKARHQMTTLEQCIINNYNAIGVDNASHTLNENFADLFSVALLQPFTALSAIPENWLVWAQTWCKVSTHIAPGPIPKNTDVHAQSHYRVLGMAHQNPDLYTTFHCRKNPQKACMLAP